ncbi:thiosulfate oxidation carrier protein SoxY [Simplicispira psychrophila]|uniref:thiosulfate oxidation carrier protein SoxY n=1 Tax=Simplicispira psychrophila TaxID=80882 RepID=UPI00068A021A|nr:thiosulfate oxidation carrier protein SoxY [Simplicispira psychrophila]
MHRPIQPPSSPLTRRALVAGAAVAGAALALPSAAWAQASPAAAAEPISAHLSNPLAPNPVEFQQQIAQFTGQATPQAQGLLLEVAVLADNPSAVPIKVKVTLPITDDDWCEEIIVLADLNPSPLACRLQFTAAAGTAEAAVRVRLSQTQTIHALARMKSGKVLAAQQSVTVAASGCGM